MKRRRFRYYKTSIVYRIYILLICFEFYNSLVKIMSRASILFTKVSRNANNPPPPLSIRCDTISCPIELRTGPLKMNLHTLNNSNLA